MNAMRKLFLSSVFLILFVMPLSAISNFHTYSDMNPTTIASTQDARILFDEFHAANGSSMFTPGNVSIFGAILRENGYESRTNFEHSLEAGILNDYDILVLFFPMVPLTTTEVTDINNFVENGGGLLLVGIEHLNTQWLYTPNNLNPLSTQFGITFNEDKIVDTFTELTTHQVTYNISSIHSWGDFSDGCTLDLSSPATEVISKDGNVIAAVAEYGSGRVVAVGTPAPFMLYTQASGRQVHPDDHYQFSLNVIDWLAGTPQRDVYIPDIIPVYVSDGPTLSEAELAEYHTFVGLIHDHTTHSDGQNTATEMVSAGLDRGYDFMVITDHSYESDTSTGKTGITGALEARRISEENALGIQQFIGAELSRGRHSLAFPLTENIFTDNQQEMVTQAHAQGAMIALCHPTIARSYVEVYDLYDDYGYDAIEVTNMGYFFGMGEDGLFKNFYGANDGHSIGKVGLVHNAAFVKNPSGPNGEITDTDLMDAILDQRIVIIDRVNRMVYGHRIWVDRYLDLLDEAEVAVSDARTIIEAEDIIQGRLLAELYVAAAETTLDYWVAPKAIKAAADATSATALNVILSQISPIDYTLQPGSSFLFTLNITNTLDDNLSFNTTAYQRMGFTTEDVSIIAEVQADSSIQVSRNSEAGAMGYTGLILNLHSFNSTDNLSPIIYAMGGLVEYFDYSVKLEDDGLALTISFFLNRRDRPYIKSGTLYYTVDGESSSIVMQSELGRLFATIGSLKTGDEVLFHIEVEDYLGNVFMSSDKTYEITEEMPTEPVIDPLVIGLAIIGMIAVVVVIVVIMKRRPV